MWQVIYKQPHKVREPYENRSLKNCINKAFAEVDNMGGMGGHDGIFLSKLKDVYEISLYNVGYGHEARATIKEINK